MTKPISRKMAVDCLLDRFLGIGAVLYCGVCNEPLEAGQNIQFDHTHAWVFGGPHEYQNLRPIHYDPCHKKKSARDVAANAKVKRIKAGGRKRKGPKIKSRAFPKPNSSFNTRGNKNAQEKEPK